MKILVVEDEQKLNAGLVEGLTHRGHVVDAAYNGVEGEALASVNAYDVIVLDIMMPERNGIEVCQNLRAKQVQTPIIFLTALDATIDIVKGLNEGADDYLVKPFSFDELDARLRSLIRRSPELKSDLLILESLKLDPRSLRAHVDTQEIELTVKEFALLEYFLRNQGMVVTREDILSKVWDQFFDSFSNVVDVHVKNLRKKLPKPYAKRIETVWGKGYRLV